jgi:uncharacterized membrane protein YphA (DoxX/SURF4 family)
MSEGSTVTGKTSTGVWIVTVLLTAIFLLSGSTKLAGGQMHIDNFLRWGYPAWFRLIVGAIEVVSALLLLLPRTAPYAAGAIVVTMVGAVGTHLVAGEASMAVVPVALGTLAAWVWWRRVAG